LSKKLTLLLAFIKFTHIMDLMIIMPLGPQLERIWGISPQQFGMLVASYTFSAGGFGLIGAFFMDRFDRKYALLFLYAGFLIGTFACALSDSYATLLFSRCLTGAFGGLLGATVLAIVGDLTPLEKRSAAMGAIMAAFSAATVFGVPFGLYLASEYSWQAPFFFLAIVGLPILVLNVLMVPNVREHLKMKRKTPVVIFKEMVSDRNQITAHIFIVLLMLGQFTIITFMAPYMVSNVGFTEGQLSYIYLIGGICTLFTAPIFGMLSDRYGPAKFFSVITALSLVPLWLLTNLPQVGIYYALAVTSLLFILITGRIIPAMTMITASVKAEQRGGFMSVNSAIQQLGAGISSYIAALIVFRSATGQLVDYDMVGYFAIVASCWAILVAYRMKTVS